MNVNVEKVIPFTIPILMVLGAVLYSVMREDADAPLESIVPEEETMDEASAVPAVSTSTGESQMQETVSKPVVPPYIPPSSKTTIPAPSAPPVPKTTTPELQSGDYVDQVFAGLDSKRCEWLDPATGEEGIALIKNGKVRVETKTKIGTRIKLYSSVATYIWTDGEKEGIIILGDMDSSAEVLPYQTRVELADYLDNNERVDCRPTTLGDSHFELPKNVSFIELSSL